MENKRKKTCPNCRDETSVTDVTDEHPSLEDTRPIIDRSINSTEIIQTLKDDRYVTRDDSFEMSSDLAVIYHKNKTQVIESYTDINLIITNYKKLKKNLNKPLKKIVDHACRAGSNLHYAFQSQDETNKRKAIEDARFHIRSTLFHALLYLIDIASSIKDPELESNLTYYGVKLRRSPFVSRSLVRVLMFAVSVTNFFDVNFTPNPGWLFESKFDTFEDLFAHRWYDVDLNSASNIFREGVFVRNLNSLDPGHEVNDPLESALAIYCLAKDWYNQFSPGFRFEVEQQHILSSIWTYAMATLGSEPRDESPGFRHTNLNTRVHNRPVTSLFMFVLPEIGNEIAAHFRLANTNALDLSPVYNLPLLYENCVFLNACLRGYTVANFASQLPDSENPRGWEKIECLLNSVEETIRLTHRIGVEKLNLSYTKIREALEAATRASEQRWAVGGRPGGQTAKPAPESHAGFGFALFAVALVVLSAAIPR
jgi:hypothetical protein